MGAVQMASEQSPQGLNSIQQFSGIIAAAPDVDLLPLCSQVTSPPRIASFEAATGQDYRPGMDVHEALRRLHPHAYDTPVVGGQEVNHRGLVHHIDAATLGGAEQPLGQSRATAPELDHCAS